MIEINHLLSNVDHTMTDYLTNLLHAQTDQVPDNWFTRICVGHAYLSWLLLLIVGMFTIICCIYLIRSDQNILSLSIKSLSVLIIFGLSTAIAWINACNCDWTRTRPQLVKTYQKANQAVTKCDQYLNQHYPYVVQIKYKTTTKYALCKSKTEAEQLVDQLNNDTNSNPVYHLILPEHSTYDQVKHYNEYHFDIKLKQQVAENQNLNQTAIYGIKILHHQADQITNGSILTNHRDTYYRSIKSSLIK